MPQILPMSIPTILIILIISITSMIVLNEMKWESKKSYLSKKGKNYPKMFFLSLFISFDSKSSILGEMNWLILMMASMVLIMSFWETPSRMKIMFSELIYQIGNQFKIALKSKKDSSEGLFISLFLLILTLNLMGLFPNIFTPSSHITMNMMISLPLWMGFMAFGWTNFTNKMFSHLVPNGTPMALISFMVMIETISNVIRSLTLSIRLMANMVSGHLLLTLMGNLMESSSMKMVLILTLMQSILSSLEMGVAFIQAYVFCMLLTLYSNDSDFN